MYLYKHCASLIPDKKVMGITHLQYTTCVMSKQRVCWKKKGSKDAIDNASGISLLVSVRKTLMKQFSIFVLLGYIKHPGDNCCLPFYFLLQVLFIPCVYMPLSRYVAVPLSTRPVKSTASRIIAPHDERPIVHT